MNTYAWTITRDYISNDDPDRDGIDSKPVNVSGPHDATPEQLALVESEGWPFKIYDDDSILYYAGRCWSSEGFGSEELFGPLDDYGTPNAGAVTIKYRNPDTGKWETL